MALYLEEKRQPNLPRRGLDPGWSGHTSTPLTNGANSSS